MQPQTDAELLDIRPGAHEYFIIGGPGCGKTEFLSRAVEKTDADGLNPIVLSLTRNTAQEAARRNPDLHKDRVGTLHSQAYRAYQATGATITIADNHAGIRAWNVHERLRPLTPSLDRDEFDSDGDPSATASLDLIMAEYKRLRATRQPIPQAGPLADFAAEWRHWCASTKAIDFNDLLERCLNDRIPPPSNPGCIFLDEAQDLTPLELALLRQWSSSAGIPLIFAGDPNQNLYRWRGSDSSAFDNLADVPPDRRRTLARSHRVPKLIHEATVRWMGDSPTQPSISYRPRDADGAYLRSNANWHAPGPVIEEALRATEQGQTAMILASCAYMLDPTITYLRRMFIPFHNPWRPTNPDWNPDSKDVRQKRPSQRILAFAGFDPAAPNAIERAELWTAIASPAAVFTDPRYGPDQLQYLTPDPDQSRLILDIISPKAIAAAASGDVRWLAANLAADASPDVHHVANTAIRNGLASLTRPPGITVGTIHSVKGGEADVAYVYPDLPLPALREWLGTPEEQAGVYRQFYVAMTRPRHSLTVCTPAATMTVDL